MIGPLLIVDVRSFEAPPEDFVRYSVEEYADLALRKFIGTVAKLVEIHCLCDEDTTECEAHGVKP